MDKANYLKFGSLLALRDETSYNVAKQTGVSEATLSSWKSGRYTPKRKTIKKIADYFSVPVEYFYDPSMGIPDDELDAFMESERVPVYDCAAGEGRVNGEYATEHISKEVSEDYSYIRIHGDSMLPKIQDGDLVKVHHQTETTPSDLTVIKVDGETATLKHVEVTDTGIWVRASNKEVFEDRFFTVKEVLTLPVTIIGKAVELTRSL